MDQGQESRIQCAVWATRLARTKPAWFTFVLIVLGASLTLFVPAQSRAAADSPAPATMTAGGKLFVKHCAACHQITGKGILVGCVARRTTSDLIVLATFRKKARIGLSRAARGLAQAAPFSWFAGFQEGPGELLPNIVKLKQDGEPTELMLNSIHG